MRILNWLLTRNKNKSLKYKHPEKPVFCTFEMPDGRQKEFQIGTMREITEKEAKRDEKIRAMQEIRRSKSIENGMKKVNQLINEK